MRSFSLFGAAVVAAGVFVACGDISGLPKAGIENRVDTVSLFALSGTPVAQPSGYQLAVRSRLRTDQNSLIDFAFDIDTAGRAVILPTGALKLGRLSGAQISAQDFDSLKFAPDVNYQLDSAVVIESNSVALLHSRPVQCSFDLSPSHVYFAKMHVLTIDTLERRMDMEILVDINCGYHGLEIGLPDR